MHSMLKVCMQEYTQSSRRLFKLQLNDVLMNMNLYYTYRYLYIHTYICKTLDMFLFSGQLQHICRSQIFHHMKGEKVEKATTSLRMCQPIIVGEPENHSQLQQPKMPPSGLVLEGARRSGHWCSHTAKYTILPHPFHVPSPACRVLTKSTSQH